MKRYFIIFVLASLFILSFKFSVASKPSDYGLEEGDLISAIFSDDPDVYIINEHGYKRLFLNPEIFKFYSHLGGFTNVRLVTSEVRDSFPTAGLFRNCEDNDKKVYGIDIEGEDEGQLRWVNTTGEQAVQDDPNFFKKVFCINKKEFNWYKKASEFKSVVEVPKYDRIIETAVASTQERIEAKAETKNIGKVIICHYPPENIQAYHTLEIDASALKAHLDHGDTVGACLTPITPATPAIPAIPAIPASPSQPIVSPSITPIPASPSFSPTPTPTSVTQPATPATPAQPTTSSPTPTPTPTLTVSPTPTATASPSFSPTPTPMPVLTSTMKVTYPNGGETLQIGNTYTIQWQNPLTAGFSGDKNIRWSISFIKPDRSYEVGKVSVTQSAFSWTSPADPGYFSPPPAAGYFIRVVLIKHCIYSDSPCPEPSSILPNQLLPSATGYGDESDSAFSIIAASTPTPTPTPTTPQPPSSVTISLLNSTTYYDVEVRWTASAIKYKIYRSTNGGEYQLLVSFFPANYLDVTGTYYDDAWVSPSTTYRYKIYGCNNDGGVTCSLIGTESNSITTRAAPTPTPTASISFDNFSRNLAIGSRGDDVKRLQSLLVNQVGYSANLITGYFGTITRDAVKRLQEKYGVKPVSGYFGEITRKALRAIISN